MKTSFDLGFISVYSAGYLQLIKNVVNALSLLVSMILLYCFVYANFVNVGNLSKTQQNTLNSDIPHAHTLESNSPPVTIAAKKLIDKKDNLTLEN